MFDIREEDTKFIWTVAVSAALLELQKAANDCIFIKIIECCSLRIEAFRSTLDIYLHVHLQSRMGSFN